MKQLTTLTATAVLSLLTLRQSALATVADDICASSTDPCVLSEDLTLDPGSQLNFGARAFQIASGVQLTWSENTTITAGSCLFDAGSKVVQQKDSSPGVILRLECTESALSGKITTIGGEILIFGAGPHSLMGSIKIAGGPLGGVFVISRSAPGTITVGAKISAKGVPTLRTGYAFDSRYGNVHVTDQAKISVQSDLISNAFFTVFAGGSATFDGKFAAKAKQGAWDILVESEGPMTIGETAKISTKGVGDGGSVILGSSQTVEILGKVSTTSKDITEDAPAQRICAGAGDVTIGAGAKLTASDKGSLGSIRIGSGGNSVVAAGAALSALATGDIQVCGTNSASVSPDAKVKPAPSVVGTTECTPLEDDTYFDYTCGH